DFIFPAFDQIVNELAKLRYRSGGQYAAPVVIRTPVGGGIKGGHYHSQSPEALFIHTPGLQIIHPSNPLDAKGLLISAIRQEAPRTCGFAAEISALIQERCFTSLEAPIARITGWDTPFPYTLESEYLPLAPRILGALRELKAYEA